MTFPAASEIVRVPVLTPAQLAACRPLTCFDDCVKEIEAMVQTATPREAQPHAFVTSVHGFRYQVTDVERSVAFYTEHLGFTLEHQQLPAFASVSLGDAQILLSGPDASGSRPMPNGQRQEPGGWNRVVLKVKDLPGYIADLKKAGLRFRNEMETGPGGRQIQIEDPDGNPIELFEPARRENERRQEPI